MTSDSTVTGGELVSPILSGDDRSIEDVREAIRIIKQNGGRTGRNVGMHVHLDATPFRRRQLVAMAANMRAFEGVLTSFVPDHRYDRRGATNGRRLTEVDWDCIENWIVHVNVANRQRSRTNRSSACPVSRASSFNFNSLLTYGTVECRLLGHTLNTVKVKVWIRVLQSIMRASRRRQVVPPGDGLEWLVTAQGLERDHADFFREVAEQRHKADRLIIAG
jgi:hypothetical protein